MKLAVEFPSVSYREGSDGVIRLARGIEDIGYDQLGMFDHVVMGYPTENRSAPMYPPEMPVLEALMTLSFIASATSSIGHGKSLGMQSMLNPPPRTQAGKYFYSDLDAVALRAEEVQAQGFDWVTINATAIFQSGARSVDALLNQLGKVHDRLIMVTG